MEKPPQEQFNADLRWILTELKQEEIANQYSEFQVEYYIGQNSNYEPTEKSQHRILKMLSDRKALKLSAIYHRMAMLSNALEMQGVKPIGYHIKFLQPAFDKIVEETLGEKVTPIIKSLPEAAEPASQTNSQAEYFITIQGRKVVLNNTLIIASPNSFSENDYFMEFVYNHEGERLTKEKFAKEENIKLGKGFHQILNSLGFSGELRKMFFKASKDAVQFTNHIKATDLKSKGIDESKLKAEISRLKPLINQNDEKAQSNEG